MLGDSIGANHIAHMALDSQGKPAIAYWLRPGRATLEYSPYGAGERACRESDRQREGGLSPDGVFLAFHGTQPRILIDTRRERGNVPEHFTLLSNDDGAHWSDPRQSPMTATSIWEATWLSQWRRTETGRSPAT